MWCGTCTPRCNIMKIVALRKSWHTEIVLIRTSCTCGHCAAFSIHLHRIFLTYKHKSSHTPTMRCITGGQTTQEGWTSHIRYSSYSSPAFARWTRHRDVDRVSPPAAWRVAKVSRTRGFLHTLVSSVSGRRRIPDESGNYAPNPESVSRFQRSI